MPRKYEIPDFLRGVQTQFNYERWLQRKAAAHIRRDRNRGNVLATQAEYKVAIHNAVKHSKGVDAYTGEELNWSLLSTYANEDSKLLKRSYKRKFDLLPTVDHVDDGKGAANFKICGWRTNDCKNDLNMKELLEFCRLIIKNSESTT